MNGDVSDQRASDPGLRVETAAGQPEAERVQNRRIARAQVDLLVVLARATAGRLARSDQHGKMELSEAIAVMEAKHDG